MIFLLSNKLFWLILVFAPLLVACAFLVPRWRPGLTLLAPWMALPAFLMAVFVKSGSSIRIPWLLLDAQFGMDATAKVFLFFTALIWLIAGVYAVFYLSDKDKKSRFFVYYLFAMCGNIGLILAQDVISFYFFFALMSFASYGLVVHSKTKSAHHAGKVYICLVILGEAFIFSSLVMAVHLTGNIYLSHLPASIVGSPMRDIIIGLALLGFGIKAGALPFHVWLPLAHPVAPTPASAILSGSMINAGLLGWLRILPLGESAFPQWGILVIGLGLLAAFYGVFVGLTQSNAKTVLAYSSISQMGMMTIIVGLGLLVPDLWPGCWAVLMVYAAHHALAKGALFLSVGTAATKISVPLLRYLRNFGLLLPALAIIGAPFTSGALAKGSLKYVMSSVSYHYQWAYLVKWLISGAAIGTTFIMARFLWLVWPKKIEKEKEVSVKLGVYLSWGLMLGMVGLLPVLTQVQEFIKLPGKETFTFLKWSALWPLVVGGVITWVALTRRWKNSFCIPEGDVLTVYTRVLTLCQSAILVFVRFINERKEELSTSLIELRHRITSQSKHIDHFAQNFGSWKVFGVMFLTLFITFFLLLPFN